MVEPVEGLSAYERVLAWARLDPRRSDTYRGLTHERFLLLPSSVKGSFWKHLMMERVGFRCPLCGETLSQDKCDIDHVLPRPLGGSNDLSNLRALCARCNRRRGNRV